MKTFSPPIEISTLQTQNHSAHIHVVREDLLPGGTKQRAVVPFLDEFAHEGYEEFVYASPFCGFAQVALAYAGAYLDKKVRLFCEKAPPANPDATTERELHALSRFAEQMGSEIEACESLEEAELKATEYADQNGNSFKLPLGFNHDRFLHFYADALEKQFKILQEKIGFCPEVLWLPVGSGTLTRVFREVLPQKVQINCVDVRVLNANDPRISALSHLKNTTVYRADIAFHQESREMPPVPSNAYYDAKLWHFLNVHGEENDVWWNVAR